MQTGIAVIYDQVNKTACEDVKLHSEREWFQVPSGQREGGEHGVIKPTSKKVSRQNMD